MMKKHRRGVKGFTIRSDIILGSFDIALDGKNILLGSSMGSIKVFSLENGKEMKKISTLCPRNKSILCTSQHIISSDFDGYLYARHRHTGEEANIGYGVSTDSELIATPDEKHIITHSRGYRIYVWSIADRREVSSISYVGQISAMTMSPDGRYFVNGDNLKIFVWDVSPTPILSMTAPLLSLDVESVALSIMVSPDGKYIISGHEDGTVCVWRMDTGEEVNRLSGHTNCINSIAITPDGQFILVGSRDSTISMWTLESGELVYRFTGHKYGVQKVLVTRDGTRAVSLGGDSCIRVWFLDVVIQEYLPGKLKKEIEMLKSLNEYLCHEGLESDSLLALMLRGVLMEDTSLRKRIATH